MSVSVGSMSDWPLGSRHHPPDMATPVKQIPRIQNGFFGNRWLTSQRVHVGRQPTGGPFDPNSSGGVVM